MANRPRSYQFSESRQPQQVVDTDTTDYYDVFGDLPPPHRLSSTYSLAAGSSDSLHEQRRFSGAISSSPRDLRRQSGAMQSSPYGTPQGSPYYTPRIYNHFQQPLTQQALDASPYAPHTASPVRVPAAGIGARPESGHSFQSLYMNQQRPMSNSSLHSSYDDEWKTGSYDQHDAFLTYENGSSNGHQSPGAAARDRFLARKEARHSAYLASDAGKAASLKASSTTYRGHNNRGLFEGKRKWLWLLGALVVVGVMVGVIAGVLAEQRKADRKGVTGAVQSDANDPSVFTKNPDLHQSFYGLCYTPLNAQYPQCGDTQDAVIEDIQLVSQLTTRLRLYGADCDVSNLVLGAIKETKVNMTVWLAAWVPQPSDDPQNVTYNRQAEQVIAAVKKYGPDNIAGITVGNEYLLNGGPEDQLLSKIADMRTQLAALNLPKTIPVGTADAGSMITETLSAGCDYVMANVHAWFAGTTVDDAAGWVYSYTSTNAPSTALQAPNKPELFIAETGWPSGANDTAHLTYEGGVAGVPELNTFLQDYVCAANQNVSTGGEAAEFSKYFFFEAFDEPWKGPLYGGVEAHWGLFDAQKTLKPGLVLPNCTHP